MFLKNSGHEVVVESAGVSKNARTGGCAGEMAVAAAARMVVAEHVAVQVVVA